MNRTTFIAIGIGAVIGWFLVCGQYRASGAVGDPAVHSVIAFDTGVRECPAPPGGFKSQGAPAWTNPYGRPVRVMGLDVNVGYPYGLYGYARVKVSTTTGEVLAYHIGDYLGATAPPPHYIPVTEPGILLGATDGLKFWLYCEGYPKASRAHVVVTVQVREE